MWFTDWKVISPEARLSLELFKLVGIRELITKTNHYLRLEFTQAFQFSQSFPRIRLYTGESEEGEREEGGGGGYWFIYHEYGC